MLNVDAHPDAIAASKFDAVDQLVHVNEDLQFFPVQFLDLANVGERHVLRFQVLGNQGFCMLLIGFVHDVARMEIFLAIVDAE